MSLLLGASAFSYLNFYFSLLLICLSPLYAYSSGHSYVFRQHKKHHNANMLRSNSFGKVIKKLKNKIIICARQEINTNP